MKKNERIDQTLSAFQSFKKDKYTKKERFSELMNIQKEMLTLTFPSKTGEKLSRMRIWDVLKYFEQEDESIGHKAVAEIDAFRKDCKAIGHLIAAEISGNTGENKAYWRLVNAECPGVILRNLELSKDCVNTELDLVVVAPNGVFIVEVKNTRKGVFIDETGDQYKTGNYTSFDSKLGEKMAFRKQLIKEHLDGAGFQESDVTGLVVYTNNFIEIQNYCPELKTCFLAQLPCLIKESKAKAVLSEQDQYAISSMLEQAAQPKSYPMDYDIDQFKFNYAQAMVAIEEAKERPGSFKERFEVWAKGLLAGFSVDKVLVKST